MMSVRMLPFVLMSSASAKLMKTVNHNIPFEVLISSQHQQCSRLCADEGYHEDLNVEPCMMEVESVAKAHNVMKQPDMHVEKRVPKIINSKSAHEVEAVLFVNNAPEPKYCLCTLDDEDKCDCSETCSMIEKSSICTDLLGACECGSPISGGNLCDCQGYCPYRSDLMSACSRGGCKWDGNFCEVERTVQAPNGLQDRVKERLPPKKWLLYKIGSPIQVFFLVAGVGIAMVLFSPARSVNKHAEKIHA